MPFPPTPLDLSSYVLALLAVVILAISKAGFGGGAGLLSVPLLLYALGGQDSVMLALAVQLPLLSACDIAGLWPYWRQWDRKNLLSLVPGFLLGVIAGALALRWLSDNTAFLTALIALLALIYGGVNLFLRFFKKRGQRQPYRPAGWHGPAVGAAAGLSSTLSHAAGPIITMYLIPQNLGRRIFVATTVAYYFLGNGVKFIPYCWHGLITGQSLAVTGALLPAIPIGAALGVYLNRRLNEDVFLIAIYVLLFLTGGKLLYDLIAV